MKSLELNKTGNFWIDNGIVALYKILRKIDEDENFNCKITLKQSLLQIDAIEDGFENKAEPNTIVSLLEKARQRLTHEYTNISDRNYR